MVEVAYTRICSHGVSISEPELPTSRACSSQVEYWIDKSTEILLKDCSLLEKRLTICITNAMEHEPIALNTCGLTVSCFIA